MKEYQWRCQQCAVEEPGEDWGYPTGESMCKPCYWVFRAEISVKKQYWIAAKYRGSCYKSVLDWPDQ